MFKTIINNGHYIFPENFSLDFPCQIDVCRFSDPIENHYRVLLLTTESSLSPNRVKAKDILSHEHKYDLILDHDVDVLSSCDNSLKFLYGSTWLNRGKINHPDSLGEYVDTEYGNEFSVSFLASWYPIDRPGYKLRQETYLRKNEITIPKVFYESVKSFNNPPNPLPNGEKECLFNSMFHLCSENQSVENYFTEKIIDCFLTKTIPIYWGCPNIAEYFDSDGIIFIENVDDLINKVNNLTEDYYNERKDVIEKNKKIAITYANLSERVRDVVSLHHATK